MFEFSECDIQFFKICCFSPIIAPLPRLLVFDDTEALLMLIVDGFSQVSVFSNSTLSRVRKVELVLFITLVVSPGHCQCQ